MKEQNITLLLAGATRKLPAVISNTAFFMSSPSPGQRTAVLFKVCILTTAVQVVVVVQVTILLLPDLEDPGTNGRKRA